jgi:hypothetical protein
VVGGQLAAAAEAGRVSALIRKRLAGPGLFTRAMAHPALEMKGFPGYRQPMPATVRATVHNLDKTDQFPAGGEAPCFERAVRGPTETTSP